ncbi:MAG: leucine-rich repeat domain-containing protein [Acholeplasmatales bacterium]|nr:leucine-rich repeat domain-containing protein [Acholeplasmatales bacterium]
MEGTISYDGKTTLNVYYNRERYDIKFLGFENEEIETINVKYGKVISAPSYSKNGYTLSAWLSPKGTFDFTKPVDDNYTLTANLIPNSGIQYRIDHYWERSDGDYGLYNSIFGYGVTGEPATFEPLSITGFELVEEEHNETINGNQSTVVKLYYRRIEYKVEIWDTSNNLIETQYVKYEDYAKKPEVEKPGYTAKYNFDFNTRITDSQRITLNWEANTNTKFTVNVYKENLMDDNYTFDHDTVYYGTTDDRCNNYFSYDEYEGFTLLDELVPNIEGDGSTVYNLYYRRNRYTVSFDTGCDTNIDDKIVKYGTILSEPELSKPGYYIEQWHYLIDDYEYYFDFDQEIDTNYSLKVLWYANEDTRFVVNHLVEDLNDENSFVLREKEESTGETLTEHSYNEFVKDYEGLTFDGDVEESFVIEGDGSTVVNLYYRRNNYHVHFYDRYNNEVSDITVKYGKKVPMIEIGEDGYHFLHWDYNGQEFNFNTIISDNIDLYPVFEANENTKYTVKYYLQNIYDDEYALIDSVEYQGQTDSSIDIDECANALLDEGKTYLRWDGDSYIKGDGSSTLEIYYHRQTYLLYVGSDNHISCQTYNQHFRYGTEITLEASFDGDLAYYYAGFFDGSNNLLSDNTTYTFTVTNTTNIYPRAQEKEELANFEYNSSSEYCVITGFKEDCFEEELTIPSCATGINDFAFYEQNIRHVYLNSNLKQINSQAFYNCPLLEYVQIPSDSQLEKIESLAFGECRSLTAFDFFEGLKYIGEEAFHNVPLEIDHITIPNSIEYLGSDPFNKDIVISIMEGSQLQNLGDNTFDEYHLDYVVYPKNLESITSPFEGAIIDKLFIPNDIEQINSYIFTSATINEIEFEDNSTLKLIDDYAFYSTNLNSIVIPKSVKEIGVGAFNSSTLTRIDFEEGSLLETIGEDAFIYSSLRILMMPENLKIIEKRAFAYCYGLSVCLVNENLQEIYDDAFEADDGLKRVANKSLLPITAGSSDFGKIAYYVDSLTDPSTIEAFEIDGDFLIYAFETGRSVVSYLGNSRSVTIPSNVTVIANYAFRNNQNLMFIDLNNVVSIGEFAFSGCSNLFSVRYGKYLTNISDFSFESCNILEIIKHPENTNINPVHGNTDFGHIAENAVSIKESEEYNSDITVDDETGFVFLQMDIDMLDIHSNAIIYYIGNDKDIVIPSNVDIIYDRAFMYRNIESLYIPKSVTYIGNYAFYYCNNLKTVTFEEGSLLETIGDNAFMYCTELESIFIPKNVKTINLEAFSYNTSLTSITFEEGSLLEEIESKAFKSCYNIESVTFPNNLTILENEAFEYCSKLKEVSFGSGELQIKPSVFYCCYELENVNYYGENNTKAIHSYAFYLCNLKYFEIGANVTYIGDDAFKGCYGLIEVYNKSSFTVEPERDTNGSVALYAVIVYDDTTIDNRQEYEENNFKYVNTGTYIVLTGYTGEEEHVIIPDNVQVIAGAFRNNKTIKTVEFTENSNIIAIWGRAFEHSTLENLIIPDGLGLKGFGEAALHECEITELDLSNCLQLELIKNSAFDNCHSLTKVILPKTIEGIGLDVFNSCSALEYVIFDKDTLLSTIPTDTFMYVAYEDTRVLNIVLPKSITSIGTYAFYEDYGTINIFYYGTEAEYTNIVIESDGNDTLASANIYYYSETEPTDSGNYWHFNEDGLPTAW